jgi:hypothetical protein
VFFAKVKKLFIQWKIAFFHVKTYANARKKPHVATPLLARSIKFLQDKILARSCKTILQVFARFTAGNIKQI